MWPFSPCTSLKSPTRLRSWCTGLPGELTLPANNFHAVGFHRVHAPHTREQRNDAEGLQEDPTPARHPRGELARAHQQSRLLAAPQSARAPETVQKNT
eukprot:5900262-Prorocentrum_lima.AAC.1